MDGIFAGDDIADGGSTFLAGCGLFRLGLWVVFDHFGGSECGVSMFATRSEKVELTVGFDG